MDTTAELGVVEYEKFGRLLADPIMGLAQFARSVGRFPYALAVSGRDDVFLETDGFSMVNFGSNDYLGLATDETVVDAAVQATLRWGAGASGSRLFAGDLTLHSALEQALADFLGKEAALVFPTGYTANLGLIAALTRPREDVFVDASVHASIRDGIRLAHGRARSFRHNDAQSLLDVSAGSKPGSLCIVEGLYSTHGDVAPLPELVAVARQRQFILVVDEAHGIGTLGDRGAGAGNLQGSLPDIDVITMTFSKALASCGGAIVGEHGLIEALRLTSRPFMFTASNTPATLAAASRALEILIAKPELVSRTAGLARTLGRQLAQRNLPVHVGAGPILALETGTDAQTFQAWNRLVDQGFYTNPVIAPAVPENHGILRLSVTAAHSDQQLVELSDACESLGDLFHCDQQTEGSGHRRSPFR